MGTAYYMAPEILIGECDCKCDIWSIGVVLFMLITGKPPFQGESPGEIIRNARKNKLYFEKEDFKGISVEC